VSELLAGERSPTARFEAGLRAFQSGMPREIEKLVMKPFGLRDPRSGRNRTPSSSSGRTTSRALEPRRRPGKLKIPEQRIFRTLPASPRPSSQYRGLHRNTYINGPRATRLFRWKRDPRLLRGPAHGRGVSGERGDRTDGRRCSPRSSRGRTSSASVRRALGSLSPTSQAASATTSRQCHLRPHGRCRYPGLAEGSTAGRRS
jgi:hypothetical protein